MIILIISCLFFFSSGTARGFELVKIQSISTSEKTFVTRQGFKNSIEKGKEATFTTDNVSIIARAISVGSEFTQWQLERDDLVNIPFIKGELVTYYPTTEHLWALAPREVMKKYLQAEDFVAKKSLSLLSSLSQTYSEAVTGTVDTSSARGGFEVEVSFDYELSRTFTLSMGGRFSKENIDVSNASLINDRIIATTYLSYLSSSFENFFQAKLISSIGLGYGQSQTSTTGSVSSGRALLLPSVKLGLLIPYSKKIDFIIEGAMESIRTEERFEDGTRQISNLANSKISVGVRKYFQ